MQILQANLSLTVESGLVGWKVHIDIGHNVQGPPRSPDLTPLDFFFGGYVKSKICQTPGNLDVLHQRIQDIFNEMRRDGRMGYQYYVPFCCPMHGQEWERKQIKSRPMLLTFLRHGSQ